jgi:hypothetical protein
MVALNVHEAGNGGKSQGKPKAHCVLLDSETGRKGTTKVDCRGMPLAGGKKGAFTMRQIAWVQRRSTRGKASELDGKVEILREASDR